MFFFCYNNNFFFCSPFFLSVPMVDNYIFGNSEYWKYQARTVLRIRRSAVPGFAEAQSRGPQVSYTLHCSYIYTFASIYIPRVSPLFRTPRPRRIVSVFAPQRENLISMARCSSREALDGELTRELLQSIISSGRRIAATKPLAPVTISPSNLSY